MISHRLFSPPRTNVKYAIIGIYNANLNNGLGEVIAIEGIYPNPNFDYNLRSHDQMIVKLVTPSSSPTVTINFDPNVPNQTSSQVTLIGFGVTQTGNLPSVLQETQMNYIPNNQCSTIQNGGVSYQGQVSSDMICFLGQNSGQCNGDSGGPYLLLGDSYETDVQVGTVSWYVAKVVKRNVLDSKIVFTNCFFLQ